ncbi:shikimate dehydrogenase [Auraticoccus sp. F435]|uniref:Shikimate dehydrogenase n=1 Tax=Auraticoccus cholistanensis TaxID=2656650 RepID=A0A6A9UWI8_9ACTN|nr:shikimate dehydrogenase [Auraticoccus cholistanensis]
MAATAGGRVCAVLGDPIEHSLSPVLHGAAYRHLGLDWEYQRHRVDAAGLAAFVAGLDGRWRGLSLTMPLKEAVLELGEPDDVVRSVGAANTLLLGDRPQVRNTDVGGLQRSLRAAGATEVGTALLLGTGATARSAVAALAGLGARRLLVVARRPERAGPLAEQAAALGADVEVLPWAQAVSDVSLPAADVAVSTVVAGAADELAAEVVAAAPVVFDVVYDPWPTVLAATAARAGRAVASGLDLLVHQAVLQVELMTGSTVPAEVLMSAGREAIGARAGR